MVQAAVTVDQLGDLLTATEASLGSPKFTQLTQKLVSYEFGNRYVNKSEKDMHFKRGDEIKEFLMIKQAATTVHDSTLFAEDRVDIYDSLDTLTVPWKHRVAAIAWERREQLMNAGKEQLVKLLVTRRAKMLLDMVEKLEVDAWDCPRASTNDTHIYGIPYWVRFNNTTDGFTGGDPTYPSGGAGGLLTATYSNWNNYTYKYTSITEDDMVDKLITMLDEIGFESPISIEDMRVGRGQKYRHYTTQTIQRALAKLGRQRNDNLGVEIAKFEGQMVLNRVPVKGLPILEKASTFGVPIPAGAFYTLDMDMIYPVWLEGDYITPSKIDTAYGRHNVLTQFYDMTYNFICVDRRRQGVLATGTGAQV